MKKLFLLIIMVIFLSCKKDDPIPEPDRNTVFYATRGQYKITSSIWTYMITKNDQITYPNCNSYSDANTGYRVVYMIPGKYNITVTTNSGDVVIPITIHTGCNTFDVANCYGW
jgi:hypothetical protein